MASSTLRLRNKSFCELSGVSFETALAKLDRIHFLAVPESISTTSLGCALQFGSPLTVPAILTLILSFVCSLTVAPIFSVHSGRVTQKEINRLSVVETSYP